MSRTLLCRASKPLKYVALLDSTNVPISWILLQVVLPIVPNFPNGASLTSYSRSTARLLGVFSLLNFVITLLGFGQVGCLKFHPFPVAIHRIVRSRKQYKSSTHLPTKCARGSISKCVLKWEIIVYTYEYSLKHIIV